MPDRLLPLFQTHAGCALFAYNNKMSSQHMDGSCTDIQSPLNKQQSVIIYSSMNRPAGNVTSTTVQATVTWQLQRTIHTHTVLVHFVYNMGTC